MIVPSGKDGTSFLSQGKRLGVRLRARQVLCSKCSSVCNEKGENVKESSRRDKELKQIAAASNQHSEQGKNGLKLVRPRSSVQVTNLEDKLKTVTAKSKGKVRYFGSKRRRKKPVSKQSSTESTNNSENKSTLSDIELDARSKRLAIKNRLVPKVKRLALSVIEKYSESSNSDRDSTHENDNSSTLTSAVTSSTSDNSMQPLRIKLSNLNKQATGTNPVNRQYSIVKSENDEDDTEKSTDDTYVSPKRNCDNEDNQPLKKVIKWDSSEEKTAPVLKISFGKKSTVLTVSAKHNKISEESESLDQEDEDLCHPSTSKENVCRRPESASSKAARKALKKAKRDAQKQSPIHNNTNKSPVNILTHSPYRQSPAYSNMGGLSPGLYQGNLSPGQHITAVSPASSSRFSSPGHLGSASPAYTLMCPSSQKIIIKKIKKKKKRTKEREDVNLDETPCSSTADDNIAGPVDETANDDSASDEDYHDVDLDRPGGPGISVESAQLSDGHTMCVGDVVWARVDNDPWWPGKIVNLMILDDNGSSDTKTCAHAQISLYTTSTTSILPCKDVKPFLESFEVNGQC